jgi:PAS domain S-box-containing protein
VARDPRGSRSSPSAPGDYSQEAHAEAQNLRQQLNVLRGFAVFTLDRAGRVATWNEGAERFLGYRADEILGHEFTRFFQPEDRESGAPARELQAALSMDHFEDEGWRLRKDGSRFWVSTILTTLRDADRNVIGFGKVMRDASERRHYVDQFRQAIEAAPTGMLLMDDKGVIVLVNEQIEKLFG